MKRAIAFLQLNQGAALQKAAETLGVNYNTVAIWRDNYLQNGLNFLTDMPRSGRPFRFNGEERAKITVLACSDTPLGRAKWSLHLLAKNS